MNTSKQIYHKQLKRQSNSPCPFVAFKSRYFPFSAITFLYGPTSDGKMEKKKKKNTKFCRATSSTPKPFDLDVDTHKLKKY